MENSITREHLLQAAFAVARAFAPSIANLEMSYKSFEDAVVKKVLTDDAERTRQASK